MKPLPIKAVLFDLDDTLWPIAPVIANAESALYDWLGRNLPGVTRHFTMEQLRELRAEMLQTDTRYQIDLWSLRHATLMHACHLAGEDKLQVDQAMSVFSVARNAVTPFDDVVPGLTRLRERFIVGSVSNGFADLQTIGIAHHFATSIAAHQFGRAKPDPSIFYAACDALGVTPQQTIYVGDDPVLDVQAAQNAGLTAVWINRFDRALPDNIVPAAICTTLHELDDWLTTRIMSGESA
jgi:putative hydrolase of the HAD superfamily